MENRPVAARIRHAQGSLSQLLAYMNEPDFIHRAEDPENCDFIFGNPHEMPPAGYVDSLQKWLVPQDKDWFAYKMNEPEARQAVVNALLAWRGVQVDPQDVFLTTGAFGALAVSINILVNPGDEVIYISPPWFFYEPMIHAAGGTPVRVRTDLTSMLPRLEAIEAAITERTRAIIINSPNNPTGKIYPPALLSGLADLLARKSRQNGRTIYLISDESYSKILFSGSKFTSPTGYYPHSLLVYTYGKTLLTPGQRVGYLVLNPELDGKDEIRDAVMTAQMLAGYAIPNALLQHAMGDLDRYSIDLVHLEQKRDRMVSALLGMGYQVHMPEATFYLLPKSPDSDDLAYVNRLKQHKVFCLPGSVAEIPGYFRISITASDAMIERSLAGFEAVIKTVMA